MSNSGVTAGGPIVKGKLFFFTSYEYVKTDLASFNFLSQQPDCARNQRQHASRNRAAKVTSNQLASSGNPTLVSVADGLRQSLVPQNNANLLKMMTRDNGFYDNLTKSHTWIHG
jgi:hypothetical protein